MKDDLDYLSQHLQPNLEGWNTDAAWRRLQGKLQQPGRNRRPWLMAALLVIGVGVGIWGRQYMTGSQADREANELRLTTSAGERRTVQLADGSSVELAPLTTLSVRYSRNRRATELNGRAFFHVARNPRIPFHVRAGRSEVHVLGTSFEVNAYPGEPVQVAVATGRVQVDAAVVAPGHVATVTGSHVEVHPADVQQLTAWRSGQLSFDNARFASVTATIERWYGVDLEVADAKLANTRVSAVVGGQSVDEVLQLLAETLDARFTRAGNRITFYSK